MEFPKIGTIEAFAMIVDINSFTPMVAKSAQSDSVAQFVRDALSGGIDMVQKHGGSVVSFMGDAFLAIMDNPDSVYMSCAGMAKDLDRQCEYISNHQENYPDDWHYAKGGPSLKISIEYGWIDISTIYSEVLGEQRLLIGPAINYASRISSGGEGNRCLVGPEAFNKHGMNQWMNSGPYSVKGKNNEGDYLYWELDLGDVWREGQMEPGEETYWG
jgi:class 3 adenylate cyclase